MTFLFLYFLLRPLLLLLFFWGSMSIFFHCLIFWDCFLYCSLFYYCFIYIYRKMSFLFLIVYLYRSLLCCPIYIFFSCFPFIFISSFFYISVYHPISCWCLLFPSRFFPFFAFFLLYFHFFTSLCTIKNWVVVFLFSLPFFPFFPSYCHFLCPFLSPVKVVPERNCGRTLGDVTQP